VNESAGQIEQHARDRAADLQFSKHPHNDILDKRVHNVVGGVGEENADGMRHATLLNGQIRVMKCSVPLLFYGNIDPIYTMEGQNSRNQQGPSRKSARERKTG
jgi:hypothetical protein